MTGKWGVGLSPKGRRMGRVCIRPCLRDVYHQH